MLSETEMETIIEQAHEAGAKASEKCVPVPMAVQESQFGEDFNPSKPYEIVEDGVCGFAWVSISPANSRFANFLKRKEIGRYSSYNKAVLISPLHGYNYTQSMQRKEAYCRAFADVISHAKMKRVNVYVESRLD